MRQLLHENEQLLRENQQLQWELDRYVAQDRALVSQERHNLKKYREAIHKETWLRTKAEKAARFGKTRTVKLKQQVKALKAAAVAHDDEVNGLYEQLLAEKQEVLQYCEQVT